MNGTKLFPLGWMIAWAVLIGLLTAWTALAGPPTDQLRPAVEQVIRTLDDPGLKPAARSEDRRRALRAVTDPVFDWSEMARRALGQHWQARTEAERQEFVALFRDVIERTYLGKIEGYSGEKVAFAGDAMDGDQATVKTRVATKQGDVGVDYRMALRGDRWLVYDVSVEGVSLVGNYRTQFNQIIRASSYQELVRKLRSRSS
jgi:phospholipid transport system substrate-binding protein